MRRSFWLSALIVAAMAIAGCGGGGGGGGGAAAPGFEIPAGNSSPITTAQEACVGCHYSGGPLDVAVDAPTNSRPMHESYAAPATQWDSAITSVAFDGTNITITGEIALVGGGFPSTVSNTDVRFTFVHLETASGGGGNENWVPYFVNQDSGSGTFQATYDRPGDWNRAGTGALAYTAGTGVFTYTLSRDPAATSTPSTRPEAPFDYAAAGIFGGSGTGDGVQHRIAMQQSNGASNAYIDFTPSGATWSFSNALNGTGTAAAAGPTNSIQTAFGTQYRNIVQTAACDTCHVKLRLHGGTRTDTEYCVTCHNPTSTDTAGTPVDFKSMVHRLHRGKDLPSVQSGASYKIVSSFGGADFTTGGFPQAIDNCAKCHTGAQGTNWYTLPSREACGTCHDRTYWTASAPSSGTGWVKHATGSTSFPTGLAQSSDSGCSGCHPNDTSAPASGFAIQNAHPWAQQAAAASSYGITIGTPTYSSSTKKVTVPFTVTGSSTDLTTGAWRKPFGASRLYMNIGWKAAGAIDYTSDGAATSSSAPGTPVSVDLLCPLTTGGATCGPNGALGAPVGYTVTGTAPTYSAVIDIPTGGQSARTGIVVVDGHPAVTINGAEGATQNIRVPMTTHYKEFSFSSTSPAEPRRAAVVDATKCMDCHAGGATGSTLSLHGENRNVDVSGADGIVICTICHNSANTDKVYRPANLALTDDNKAEESVDFKYMIHRIHAGRDTTDGYIEIFGYQGSKNKFAGELPPGGRVLSDCTNCHNSGQYTLPLLSGMQGTTISSGASRTDHADDLNISPNTAVCSGCHDSVGALTHMQVMGGNLSVKEADIEFY